MSARKLHYLILDWGFETKGTTAQAVAQALIETANEDVKFALSQMGSHIYIVPEISAMCARNPYYKEK